MIAVLHLFTVSSLIVFIWWMPTCFKCSSVKFKTINSLCCVHTTQHKLCTVLMTLIHLKFSSYPSVMPSFFQVAALYKFDSNIFFFVMQQIATQEAVPYSRTSDNILDYAEIKSLMQVIILEYKYYF